MSLTPYHLHWSDGLIKRVELRLRQLHACMEEFYQMNNYSFTVRSTTASGAVSDNDNHKQRGNENANQPEGPINTVGSFLLRTCVHSTSFYETQAERGVGADLALIVPEEVCSLKDIQDGLYLEKRQEFLLKVEKYLKKYNEEMLKKTVAGAEGKQHGKDKENDSDDDEDEEEEDNENKVLHSPVIWDIQKIPFGGCWANREKQILRITFIKVKGDKKMKREVFHVDVHFQPIALTGRIASAAAVRKNSHYSYLVQEDALMTVHLRKLHELYSQSQSLLRATVFLKCWAHHVGLMSSTSGHPEGLSGFHISAFVLRLVEEGVISPSMSEENVVRAVWVNISRGFTSKTSDNRSGVGSSREMCIPASEERGEVAVLRLSGETMNLLFRTSADFFEHVVQSAAVEALAMSAAVEAVTRLPFRPLPLRFDFCLVVALAGGDSGAERPELRGVVLEALAPRARYATVWRCGPDTLRVAVRAADGEAAARSRLTRGPPLEDTAAVARFDEFWGTSVTSTRQFPDGGVYRCVLWNFEDTLNDKDGQLPMLPAAVVMARVLEFALRRHIAPEARVQQLMNGLHGILYERVGSEWRDAAPLVQKTIMEACRDVETMVAAIPRTSLPCKLTSLDIIAPTERYTATFPVRPHLALTYTTDDLTQPCFAGISTASVIEPIHAVLTIDDKNKIPDTPEAIAKIKGAICAQLSKVLQEHYGKDNRQSKKKNNSIKAKKEENSLQGQEGETEKKKFRVRTSCTSHSVDIIYKGFLFRLYIAHYREVSLLKALQRESEAAMIERKLFWSVQHAKFLRTIAFGHQSYATATRLANRWLSSMVLLEFILPEAVELLVANAYLGSNPPKTSEAGFMRFLQLLATHDWSTPLVLPYAVDDKVQADAAALMRTMGEQQGMFIATPYAPLESPFTAHTPRPMIMHRVVQLAKNAMVLLLNLIDGRGNSTEIEATLFTPDPRVFDFHMAFHPDLLLQPDRALTPPFAELHMNMIEGSETEAEGAFNNSSNVGGGVSPTLGSTSAITTKVSSLATGASPFHSSRVWQLDELEEEKSSLYLTELVEREPAAHVVRTVRAVTRDRCMVFFDCIAPRDIYVITITPSPMRDHCKKLHDDILRVSRGALLPADWTLGGTAAAAAEAKSKRKNAVTSTKRTVDNKKKPVVAEKKSSQQKRLRKEEEAEEEEEGVSEGVQQLVNQRGKKSRYTAANEEGDKKKKASQSVNNSKMKKRKVN
ncbi:uncharacterized protein TM35_000034400 [Trypanosoma theileri]|uniref:U3 small nucleolar RNA-associated protein 22 n=1 Tax=Trypanosoma theileri TaxID=67003 RepID=A0A1X0P6X2_9TRYP|nr:uncharacterized protein TM35_000034400 [Trypanosoma theileri]ORC92687.1 hypothetical protein TM35_000034400 [Trypanosoma theileri]